MQSNVTLNKPSQFRYFMCSSSSTPGATNEALDYLHQVCLRQHLFCWFVLLWDSIQGWIILITTVHTNTQQKCNLLLWCQSWIFSWFCGKETSLSISVKTN